MGAINYSWIQSELQGLYGANVIREMEDIIGIYEWYDGTAQIWDVASGLDYRPTRMRTNLIKKLINEEARFMLSRAPEIRLKPENAGDQQAADECEKWLNDIMDRTRFKSKLIKAGRDCFIGKRVAIKLTGGRDAEINITFHPSLEFVFDVDAADAGKITKIIFFYQVTSDETDRAKQRIWRQKFEMKGKRCILNEALYDGYGALVEQYHADADTGLNFIPAYVIINSGLTGDVSGESDARELIDNQDAYNRLKSDNADAMKFNMFPMRVFLDASQDSMEGLTIAPNAAIDLSTDPASEGGRADAKMMESAFQYGEQLENTLNRIKSDMHDIVGVPEVTPEQLKGTAMSGKAMKALYWNLICRCEEKWSEWDDALKWMAEHLIEMGRVYGQGELPEFEHTVQIEHLYPIADDEEDERINDMAEVQAQVRSRRGYITKWQPEGDAEGEIKQIAVEQAYLSDGFR